MRSYEVMITRALMSLRVKPIVLASLVILSSAVAAEPFRISRVVAAAGDGVEEMVYSHEGREEKIFVKKEAVVTDKDVKEAWPGPPREAGISVTLNEAGAAKMAAATSGMEPGRDRMAMIIDGKVISAPVIRSVPLGASMTVSGFDDLDREGLRALAAKISGRPLPAPEEAASSKEPVLPKVKYVEYTEEEYRQIKEGLEKVGIHYVDKIPTDAELGQALHEGMSREEVEKIFGKPFRSSDGNISYYIAPEKRPAIPPGQSSRPEAFSVSFEDGKAKSWKVDVWSDAPRQMKVEGAQKGILKATPPSADFSAADFDAVSYVEAIKIPDPSEAAANQVDLAGFVSLVTMMSTHVEQAPGKITEIDPNCDLMVVLARYIPEIAELKKQAGAGKLPLIRLKEAVSPYSDGRKSIDSLFENKAPPPEAPAK